MDFKQKEITKSINKALEDGFEINTNEDENFLERESYSWDDLNQLKTELGERVMEFISQVNMITTNQLIANNLGEHKTHFQKVVLTFYSDINEFSKKIKILREEHEHLSGKVKNINEFNVYNRIAITYHSLFMEMTTLITPTLSDLVLTVSKIEENLVLENQPAVG